MDEDEKEMLAEARARLANTQGKKAKRKAREKQMEEARRLASLQKRRELRAAGINLVIPLKRRKRGVEYNEEIPFEKKAPSGFYDTSLEDSQLITPETHSLIDKEVDEGSRDLAEAKERKKDREKQKKKKESDLPAFLQMNQSSDNDAISKRSKLVLPAPQISDNELTEVVKLGLASEGARSLVEDSGIVSSQQLLADYSVTPCSTPLQVSNISHTPVASDTLMQEAQTLLALRDVETPLKGGANTPLYATHFNAATPLNNTNSATHPLMLSPFSTPQRNSRKTAISDITPQRSVRDQFNINEEMFDPNFEATVISMSQLKSGLRKLPSPKNDFEIVIPEKDKFFDDAPDFVGIEDASEVDKKNYELQKKEEEKLMKTWSQPVQRNLPRPTEVNTFILKGKPHKDQKFRDLYQAEELIKQETLQMLRNDILYHPMSNSSKNKSYLIELKSDLDKLPQETHTEEDLLQVKELLSAEELVVREGMGHNDIVKPNYDKVWNDCYSEVLFVPSLSHYTRASIASTKDRLEGFELILEKNRVQMAKDAKRATKLEKKLKILFGGYIV
jgi:pre-mRNA-splicing factor CDC5/CEF1